ncbi:MAG: FAD:protein FMN transferase [Gemmatimonadales bacterium]|nr:FAD:protein FMN transferase [Gemmatimonadales bacterium]
MGTRFEVVLPADDPGAVRPAGEAALAEIEDWHRRLSRFAPDSLLGHIHRAAVDAPVTVDREMMALLEDCRAVWQDSGGSFDPTLGTGMEAVQLDPGACTIRLTRPGVRLDFGGIGKGHAIDCAVRVLREAGITSALVHGGTSSVIGLGCPPDDTAWKVALAGSGNPPRVVALVDRALGASSNAARPHIIDPRRAHSARQTGLVAVTGPSARRCDAWATATLVLGRTPEALPAGYEAIILA